MPTIHDHVKTTKDQQKKPSVCVVYDHTKGGVDVFDLLSTTESTRIKSRRWPLNTLALILDTFLSNAKTIFKKNIQQIKWIEDNFNE